MESWFRLFRRVRFPALAVTLFFILGTPMDGSARTVLCVGESITWGYQNAASHPDRLRNRLGPGNTVINAGLSGEFSFEAVNRLPGLLQRYSPTHVVILYGTNDSTFFLPGAATAENLRQMALAVAQSGAIPIVGTITPHIGKRANRMPVVNDLNARIRWNRSSGGYLVADLQSAFDPAAPLMQSDGFHPNDAGAQRIADSFYDLIVLADQQGTQPQWSYELQTWLYPQDRGWRWSYDYMNVVPDVGNGFAFSTLLGAVFRTNGDGFLWSDRLGWMKIDPNGSGYFWSQNRGVWLPPS